MTGIKDAGAEGTFTLGVTLLLDPDLQIITHFVTISKNENRLFEDKILPEIEHDLLGHIHF